MDENAKMYVYKLFDIQKKTWDTNKKCIQTYFKPFFQGPIEPVQPLQKAQKS